MLKTTIERIGDDRLKLGVEVPPDVMQDALDATLVIMSREVNLPGFRPGKVPPQAVLARVGRDAAMAEAVRYHLDDWYRFAVAASGIRPVAAPDIDFPESMSFEGNFAFTATVEVAPKPSLPELATIEVERPKLPDITPYVTQVLDATVRGAGTLEPTGKPAASGDEVVVDFNCSVDGEDVRGASAIGYEARLGEGRLLDELEEAILGQEAGSRLTVPVDFADNHPMDQLAGRHAEFTVHLREVAHLQLPELTDEVARTVSEFDTAVDLRADVEQSISERLQGEIDGIFRANAVTRLAEVAELTEPQVLVEGRQQELYMGLKQQLAQAGMTIEAYTDRTGQTTEALFAELEKNARDDLRRELCLLALAEDHDIEVTEADLQEEIREHARSVGDNEEAAIARVYASGRIDLLRGELLMQRTIDYLVGQVKPVETELTPAPAADEQQATGDAESEPAEQGSGGDEAK